MKNKRIQCKFCGEKILQSATKCRFCGEWIQKSVKNNLSNRNNKRYIFLSFIILIILTLFAGNIYSNNQELIRKQTYDHIQANKIKPSPSPLISPSPNPTSQPTSQKTNTTETNIYNPNKPVHCPINERCGGGTTPLTQQECDQSICCEVKPNEWKLLIGNDICNSTQLSNGMKTTSDSNNTNTNKLPFNATETSSTGTFYCYEDKINTMTSQQSFVKTLRENYESCRDSSSNNAVYQACSNDNKCYDKVGSEIESCYQSCYQSAYSGCNNDLYISEQSKLNNMKWDNCP